MSDSNEESEQEKQSSKPSYLTLGELEQLEDAAEKGDLEAQKKLAEAEGVETYEEYKQLVERSIVDTEQRNSEYQSILKSIADSASKIDMSAFFANTATMEEALNLSKDSELAKFMESAMPDKAELSKAFYDSDVSQFLQQDQIDKITGAFESVTSPLTEGLTSAMLRPYYPYVDERPVDDKSEDYWLEDYIVDSLAVYKFNLAFDILDAATARCLPSYDPLKAKIKRTDLTSGSVGYDLYEKDGSYFGKIIIRKTGDKKSEIEVKGPDMPDGHEVIWHYYNEVGWRIKDGSYQFKAVNGSQTISETDLAGLANQLQQKRQKQLLEVVIPHFFDRLKLEDIWSLGEQPDFLFSNLQSAQIRQPEPKYKEILNKVKFEDNTGWDLTLIEMWNQGYSRSDIARRVSVSDDRVTNRISELRRYFGKNGGSVLPYANERKKQILKSRGVT